MTNFLQIKYSILIQFNGHGMKNTDRCKEKYEVKVFICMSNKISSVFFLVQSVSAKGKNK